MATTTSEKIKKLRTELFRKSLPLMKRLYDEGKTEREITGIIKKVVDTSVLNYYKNKQFEDMQVDYKKILKHVEENPTNKVFAMLQKHNISFDFQYAIGSYQVDFLIDDFLIFEIEDSKAVDIERDKYFNSLGFEILRVPLWVLEGMERTIVEEINQILAG